MQKPENWNKIISLLRSGDRDNIELAYQLAGQNVPLFWTTLRNLKDILSVSKTQPTIHWLEMPFGQLCYVLKIIIAMSLKDTSLKELPAEIAFFQSLVILEIDNCAFEQLPTELGQLQKLKTLSIKNSSITTLPESISNLSKLQTLILSNNQLLKLPDALQDLPNLKHLDISNNPQLILNKKAIIKLPKLEKLVVNNSMLNLKSIQLLQNRNIVIDFIS